MKQRLLLIVLAFGMCCTMSFSQEKTYEVEDDGFEWYRIMRKDNGTRLYGAEDRYGNLIIPVEYELVSYWILFDQISSGFRANKDGYTGWYNKSGKCIIPYTRKYTGIVKHNDKDWGTYYWVRRDDGSGICDMNGKEIVFIKGAGNVWPKKKKSRGGQMLYYFLIDTKDCDGCEEKWGVADANGKIVIISPDYITDNQIFKFVKTTNNPFKGNRNETIEESEGQHFNKINAYSSSSSSSNNNSNSNSGNGTTTVVVEHHRDPMPVQEWQQCTSCLGAGKFGCDRCGGSGTIYIGDNLKTCHYCNGHGEKRCALCAGKGGQYVTVYR